MNKFEDSPGGEALAPKAPKKSVQLTPLQATDDTSAWLAANPLSHLREMHVRESPLWYTRMFRRIVSG